METKQKPSKCPECGEMSLWHNEGVSKKNNKPYANEKCNKCGYLIWLEIENKPSPKAPEGSRKPALAEVDIDPTIEILAKLDLIIKACKAILEESNPEAYYKIFE